MSEIISPQTGIEGGEAEVDCIRTCGDGCTGAVPVASRRKKFRCVVALQGSELKLVRGEREGWAFKWGSKKQFDGKNVKDLKLCASFRVIMRWWTNYLKIGPFMRLPIY